MRPTKQAKPVKAWEKRWALQRIDGGWMRVLPRGCTRADAENQQNRALSEGSNFGRVVRVEIRVIGGKK